MTAYYDDGSVKYNQMKNKIATDTYVTYSTAYWYDADGRWEAVAECGSGSLPDPWPGSAPSSSDTVHVTTYTRDKLGRTTKVTDPEGMEITSAYDQLSRKTEEVRDAADGGREAVAECGTGSLPDPWPGSAPTSSEWARGPSRRMCGSSCCEGAAVTPDRT